MTEHVILLHGLWMRGFVLQMLYRRMLGAGFHVHRFDYLSLAQSREDVLACLAQRIEQLAGGGDGNVVHLVGHSLGGLVALQLCLCVPDLPPGRVVCLGSPLRGSASARGFAGLGRRVESLLGQHRELLEHGMQRWDGPRQVGMIAGNTPLGLGAVLTAMAGEHDGTVAVEETRLPGLTDHRVVDATHTGLLFSAEVAHHAAHFLRHGRFA